MPHYPAASGLSKGMGCLEQMPSLSAVSVTHYDVGRLREKAGGTLAGQNVVTTALVGIL